MRSRTSLRTSPPEGLACCFLKAVIQTNGGDFTLCYVRRRDTMKRKQTRGADAGGRVHAQKWDEIAAAATLKTRRRWRWQQQQQHHRARKKEERAIRMAKDEPSCDHFLVLFSLFLSSTYTLCSEWKEGGGRERKKERDGETCVGSYCVSMIAPSLPPTLTHNNATHGSSLRGAGACSPFREGSTGADLEEEPQSDLQRGFLWRPPPAPGGVDVWRNAGKKKDLHCHQRETGFSGFCHYVWTNQMWH